MELKPQYKNQEIPGYIPGDISEEDYSNTAGLGIAVTLSFIIIILYSVFTSHKATGKIGSAVLSKGKKYMTISQASYYSSKPITFLTTMLFACLGTYMLYRKNFFELEVERVIVIAFFILSPIVFMLFTFVGPNNILHFPLAGFVFIGGTITCYAIYSLYDKYFIDDQTLNNFKSLIIAMIIDMTIILLIIIFNLFILLNIRKPKKEQVKVPKQIIWFFDDLLAFGEYIHISIYIVILYIFSGFVALPSLKTSI